MCYSGLGCFDACCVSGALRYQPQERHQRIRSSGIVHFQVPSARCASLRRGISAPGSCCFQGRPLCVRSLCLVVLVSGAAALLQDCCSKVACCEPRRSVGARCEMDRLCRTCPEGRRALAYGSAVSLACLTMMLAAALWSSVVADAVHSLSKSRGSLLCTAGLVKRLFTARPFLWFGGLLRGTPCRGCGSSGWAPRRLT